MLRTQSEPQAEPQQVPKPRLGHRTARPSLPTTGKLQPHHVQLLKPGQPEHSQGPHNEMVCTSALQMSLYFNASFFPLWWVSSIMILQMKYPVLLNKTSNFTTKINVVTVTILITLTEAIRYYLGYMGNLQGKVPEWAGFWLLSLLLQLSWILFLFFNEGIKSCPGKKAIHIVFTTFLTFQVVSAFWTLRKKVNQLATCFHLQDFDRLSVNRGGMRMMRSWIEEIWPSAVEWKPGRSFQKTSRVRKGSEVSHEEKGNASVWNHTLSSNEIPRLRAMAGWTVHENIKSTLTLPVVHPMPNVLIFVADFLRSGNSVLVFPIYQLYCNLSG